MTHKQLLAAVAKKLELTPKEAAILWQQTAGIIGDELGKQEKVRIKNFGAFVVVKHKSRTVPDPREKGKKLVILDQYLPKFRPSEELRHQVKSVIPQQLDQHEGDEAHSIPAPHPEPAKAEEAAAIPVTPSVKPTTSTTSSLQNLITSARKKQATAIHIEPKAGGAQIRERIEGTLTVTGELDQSAFDRISQELGEAGRHASTLLSLTVGKEVVQVRFSVLPTALGNRIVLKPTTNPTQLWPLAELDFHPDHLRVIEQGLTQGQGLILTVGPAGSGLSTTLYALTNETVRPDNNVMSYEEEINQDLPGITQVQSGTTTLNTLANQDADTIMIRPLTDVHQTAEALKIAQNRLVIASLVSHLSLADTLHHLIDKGIEPSLLTRNLSTLINQRLVKRLCEHCRISSKSNRATTVAAMAELHKLPKELRPKNAEFWEAAGCESCNQTGYAGRIAIQEVWEMTDELKKLIRSGATANMLQAQARKDGALSLKQDGLLKAVAGLIAYKDLDEL